MVKKCILCGEEEAKFVIKDTNNYYCDECAKDMFDNVSVLQTVEEQARKLKEEIDKHAEDEEESE